MISQYNGVHALDRPPSLTPELTTWLSNWPSVRREVETLLAAYERRNVHYDPHWTEWAIESVDSALANLSYRAAWLKMHLERGGEEAHGLSDDDYFARLAEEQVG